MLSFGWVQARRFDPTLRAVLDTIADLVGQTLERAELYEAEHSVVVSLQRRLLAPPPEVPGLDIAAHYEPAVATVGMGGDWYEVMALEDGTVAVVVGDVIGHGVDAGSR